MGAPGWYRKNEKKEIKAIKQQRSSNRPNAFAGNTPWGAILEGSDVGSNEKKPATQKNQKGSREYMGVFRNLKQPVKGRGSGGDIVPLNRRVLKEDDMLEDPFFWGKKNKRKGTDGLFLGSQKKQHGGYIWTREVTGGTGLTVINGGSKERDGPAK